MRFTVALLKFILRMLLRIIAWSVVIIFAVYFTFQYLWSNNPEYFYEKYINDGSKYMSNGQYLSAHDEFMKARDFQPDNPKAYIYLATLYEKQQDTAAAMSSLEYAVTLDKPDAATYAHLLDLYVASNVPDERKASMVFQAATDYPSLKFEKYLDSRNIPQNRADLPDMPEINMVEGSYQPPLIITVTNLRDDEYCYYTLDGEDPTMDALRYDAKGGIILPQGRTTLLKIIKMDSHGLYSNVSAFQFTLSGEPDKLDPKLNALSGNNIINFGYAAAGGKYIFYSSSNTGGHLWRLNPETGKSTRLVRSYCDYVNATSSYVYFANWDESRGIYRCRFDGSDLKLLLPDSAALLNICDDRLYYVNNTDGGKLHVMTLTGSNDRALTDFAVPEYNIYGGYIIYRNPDDGDRLYRMKLDGSERVKLSNHRVSGILAMDGQVYYSNMNDGRRIYAVTLQGSEPRAVTRESVREFNVAEGFIFYRSADRDGFYRCGTDGSDTTEISDKTPTKINIAGGYLFFKDYSETLGFYRCTLNGGNLEQTE